jgi:hypothetical protein
MNTPVAIVVAAVIVAVALLVAFRWEIATRPSYPALFILDRWTGKVVACLPPPSDAIDQAEKNHHAIPFLCEP